MLESLPKTRLALGVVGVIALWVLAFVFTKYLYAPWSGAYTSVWWLLPMTGIVGSLIFLAIVAMGEVVERIREERGIEDVLWFFLIVLFTLVLPIGLYHIPKIPSPTVVQQFLAIVADFRFICSGMIVMCVLIKVLGPDRI